MSQSTLALSYASLVLPTEETLNQEKLRAVLEAAGVAIEGPIFDAFCDSAQQTIGSLLENIASGSAASSQMTSSASHDQNATAGEEPAKEEEEDEDDDMGLGLFD